MFDCFHSSGAVHSFRERLKRAVRAGVIELAVPRSITLDIPSGPEAVLTLWVESSLKTSSWEQVTLGLGGAVGEMLGTGSDLVKQEV